MQDYPLFAPFDNIPGTGQNLCGLFPLFQVLKPYQKRAFIVFTDIVDADVLDVDIRCLERQRNARDDAGLVFHIDGNLGVSWNTRYTQIREPVSPVPPLGKQPLELLRVSG